MEIIALLWLIGVGGFSVCYCVKTRERHQAEVAMEIQRTARETDENYVRMKIIEMSHEAERERLVLSDGGGK